MARIKVESLYNFTNCETCGGNSEEGGRVWIDDKLVFEHIPHAGCYDNVYITETELIEKALNILGHTLEVTYNEVVHD